MVSHKYVSLQSLPSSLEQSSVIRYVSVLTLKACDLVDICLCLQMMHFNDEEVKDADCETVCPR